MSLIFYQKKHFFLYTCIIKKCLFYLFYLKEKEKRWDSFIFINANSNINMVD